MKIKFLTSSSTSCTVQAGPFTQIIEKVDGKYFLDNTNPHYLGRYEIPKVIGTAYLNAAKDHFKNLKSKKNA